MSNSYTGLNRTKRDASRDQKTNDTRNQIIAASQQFYDVLTSKNGRFSYFECEDKLFPYAKPVASEDSFVIHRFYEMEGNSLLIGEGGIGKTTSLLWAWKNLLKSEKMEQCKLIPLYIPLNEANSGHDGGYISQYCNEHYHFSMDIADSVLGDYGLLFLLDGFNEITVGVTDVVTEIRRLCQASNKKVVLTSRYDFISTYMLENITSYEIQLLDRETITNYLHDHYVHEVDIPYDLLATPMMLTLFTNTNLIKRKISQQIRGGLPFCDNNTKGELLYNFMLCQVGKTFDPDHIENIYISYLSLFVVSPFIAYVIEKEGKFDFPHSQLTSLIRESLQSLNEEIYEFLFENDLASLAVFGPAPVFKKNDLVRRITTFLRNTLAILQEDGDNLSFRHQHFRDYFVAIHTIFDIRLALWKQEMPKTMMERMIPNYISEFIGDCLQEYEVSGKHDGSRLLENLLTASKGKKAEDIPLLINNVVNILSLARKNDLSGVVFQDVDLSRVSLNGLRFSQDTRRADFFGARLSANTFLPQGHIEQVRGAVYSRDGSRILTAGDTTVKEWDAITGQCLMTFVGHTNLVNSAVYSKDEKNILTAANDNSVREWDRKSGQCLHIWQDHQGYVTKAIYLPDGSGFLSSSWDGKVLLYQKKDEQVWTAPRIVAQHNKNVKSVAVSKDGCYCLTASGDHTAKEWLLEDGSCRQTYHGHSNMVNSVMYSPDEKSVLTGSYDTTVRIFDRKSGHEKFKFENEGWVRNAIYDKVGESILIASHTDCVVKELKRTSAVNGKERWIPYTTYSGHKRPVTNVALNPDETKVISASEDGSVREWDRLSSQCIKIYSGNMFSTTDTIYSTDGLLVLTIKGSAFSVAKRRDGIAIRTFSCGSASVTSVDFSPDSQWILSTSADCLYEWERETDERIAYHLINPQSDYVAEHARYADNGNQIICMSRSNHASGQVNICIFDRKCIEPKHVYPLPVDAIGIQPIKGESAFFTISSNAVVRKWRTDDGAFLGIDGVEVEGCDFSDCCFLDLVAKEIIAESNIMSKNLYISCVQIGDQTCPLNGKSLLIYVKNNSDCFTFIDDIYRNLCQRRKEQVILEGNSGHDTEEMFQEFWENDKYVKLEVDTYGAFSQEIQRTEKQAQVFERFFSLTKWKSLLSEGSLEKKVVLWILSVLLEDENGELSEDRYYCRGIVLIKQIDAGVCSPEIQRGIVAALMKAFPNLQFIISSSASEIGTGVGAATAMQLGAKVLTIGG